MYVCPSAWNNSAPTGRIFMKFDIWVFRTSVEKIQVSLKSEKLNGCFTWRPIYILIITCSFVLRMRSVSDKRCRENQNTLCPYFFLLRKSYRLWDNVEKFGTAGQALDENTARLMRVACCIPKATDAHSECAILIAFPLQQWLHERASMWRSTYVARLLKTLRALLIVRLRTEKTACRLKYSC
jgi:hypothetical protein